MMTTTAKRQRQNEDYTRNTSDSSALRTCVALRTAADTYSFKSHDGKEILVWNIVRVEPSPEPWQSILATVDDTVRELRANTCLRYLQLRFAEGSTYAPSVALEMAGNHCVRTLTHLDLHFEERQLGEYDWNTFAAHVLRMTALRELTLAVDLRSVLMRLDALPFCGALTSLRTLGSLDLSGCATHASLCVGNAALRDVITLALAHNAHLTYLALPGTSCGTFDGLVPNMIDIALSYNGRALRHLHAACVVIGHQDIADRYLQLLATNETLETLHMPFLTCPRPPLLAGTLATNSRLTALHMRVPAGYLLENTAAVTGYNAYFEGLQKNYNLRLIDMRLDHEPVTCGEMGRGPSGIVGARYQFVSNTGSIMERNTYLLHSTALLALVLAPLHLPPYVVLEILDWLPHMKFVRHGTKIAIIIGVHNSRDYILWSRSRR